MKILLTGANGQLGTAIQKIKPPKYELICTNRKNLDLSNISDCKNAVLFYKPSWVINAGAYTNVDQAENEYDKCFAVNSGAPKAFAEALKETGGSLLQISTDFVFNGDQGKPYQPNQSHNPLNIYGKSKSQGEKEALKLEQSIIIRTSWLYSSIGKNFCSTMLKLHKQKSEYNQTLNIVADQIACPTNADGLAKACWKTIQKGNLEKKILHWCDSGIASWYDFAFAIGELAVSKKIISKAAIVKPIRAINYPTLALRPHFSLLDCNCTREYLDIEAKHWRSALSDVLSQINDGKLSKD